MEIEQLRPRLWRWTATHPDWSPEEGGPDGVGAGGLVATRSWRRTPSS